MSKYKTILFDLDGTLADTSRGIFGSVRFAEREMGLRPLDSEILKGFIGPPPMKSYMTFHGLSEQDAAKATALHREYGAKQGVYEAELYPETEQLLSELKSRGAKLGVCTLKRQDIAEEVLRFLNISQYFGAIVGIDKGETLSKSDTINIALEMLGEDRQDAVLVGDSEYDAQGAKISGVDFIGILYGFGLSESEKYDFICAANVEELRSFLTK